MLEGLFFTGLDIEREARVIVSLSDDAWAQEDTGTAVVEIVLPEHWAVDSAVRDHALANFVSGSIAGPAASLEQNVVLFRVAEPGAENTLFWCPDGLAGTYIDCDDLRVLVHGETASGKEVDGLPGHFVEIKDAATTEGNGVVSDFMMRLVFPEHLSAVTVHGHELLAAYLALATEFANGDVVHQWQAVIVV